MPEVEPAHRPHNLHSGIMADVSHWPIFYRPSESQLFHILPTIFFIHWMGGRNETIGKYAIMQATSNCTRWFVQCTWTENNDFEKNICYFVCARIHGTIEQILNENSHSPIWIYRLWIDTKSPQTASFSHAQHLPIFPDCCQSQLALEHAFPIHLWIRRVNKYVCHSSFPECINTN